MRTVGILGETFAVAGEWDELTDEQLVYLAELLKMGCMVQEVKVKMLLFALSARVRSEDSALATEYAVRLKKGTVRLRADELYVLSTVFDYLFDDGGQLDVRLTENPFPCLAVDGGVLCGPGAALEDVCYGQFVLLQSYLSAVRKEASYVDVFLSVLWKKGSYRAVEEGDVSMFAGLEEEVKTVMLWYYVGSLRALRLRFPRVFSGNGSEGEDVFGDQMRIVEALSDGDVTKMEQVKRSMLYDVLYGLEYGIERSEKKPRR